MARQLGGRTVVWHDLAPVAILPPIASVGIGEAAKVCTDPLSVSTISALYSSTTTWTSGSSTKTGTIGTADAAVILWRHFVGIMAPVGELARLGTGADYTVSGLGLTWGAARGSAVISTATKSGLAFFVDGVGTPTTGTLTITKSGTAPATNWLIEQAPAAFTSGLVLPIDPPTGTPQTSTGAGNVTATLVPETGAHPCNGVYQYWLSMSSSGVGNVDAVSSISHAIGGGGSLLATSDGTHALYTGARIGDNLTTLAISLTGSGEAQIAGCYEINGHSGVYA